MLMWIGLGLVALGLVLYVGCLPAKSTNKKQRQDQLGDALGGAIRGGGKYLDNPTASSKLMMEESMKGFADSLYKSPPSSSADTVGCLGIATGVSGVIVLIIHFLLK